MIASAGRDNPFATNLGRYLATHSGPKCGYESSSYSTRVSRVRVYNRRASLSVLARLGDESLQKERAFVVAAHN
jgi:hypothetical protein